MKKRSWMVALLMLLCLVVPQKAQAKWTGVQILTVGAIDNLKLSEDGVFAARASAHLFWVPEADFMLWFGYAGPRFNINDWLWLSPQIGVAGNWDPSGGDAFLTSLWAGITPDPNVSIFLEGDFYFYGEGQWDYYGFYSLDYMLGDISVGPTFEHVNEDLILGPHVTLYTGVGPWMSVQYYVAAKPEFEHTVRFVTGLFF